MHLLKNIVVSFLFLWIISYCGFSQDLAYAKRIIDTLCADTMFGRGYYNYGDKKAADFLVKELKRLHVDSFPGGYYQKYFINMNVISGGVKLNAGKKSLKPGIDFLVDASSPTAKGKFKTIRIDSSYLSVKENVKKLTIDNFKGKILLIDKKNIADKKVLEFLDNLYLVSSSKAEAYVYISDKKLVWGVSGAQHISPCPVFEVNRSSLPEKTDRISYQVKSTFMQNYETNNVSGYIKGKSQADTFIVFTAHYDHLGMMGPGVMFPGAHDNASGVAMALDLMKYYALPENTPYYSIAFIATSAEEAGLLGAEYFSSNPAFKLSNIKFLINLDMVSTGDDGIMVVNGSIFKKEFDELLSINEKNKYLKSVAKRGEAKNSDHWYFYKNGVKCFFIYTMGGKSEYHNILDKPENLSFTEYHDLFLLLTEFIKSFH